MKQVIQFIQNHLMLCAAFGVVLVLLIFEELKNAIGGFNKITANDATLMIAHKNAIVLDLRDRNTFLSGHILNSINTTIGDFELIIKKIEKYKDSPIIMVDNKDSNYTQIGKKLKQHGFNNIYTLENGIVSWQNAKLPLTTKK